MDAIDTTIPLPSAEFIQELYKPKSIPEDKVSRGKFIKYEKEYDKFCRWIALPKEERDPITLVAFEKKYRLSKGATSQFQTREDFQARRLKYFWEWMMEKFPDVVYAMYKGGIKGSAQHAKAFIELVSKHIHADKPSQTIQTLNIIGVSQDALNKLAIPKGYDKALQGGEKK